MILLGGLPAGGRLAAQNIRAAESFYNEKMAVQAAENYARSKAPQASEQISRAAGETLSDDKYYIRAQGFMETVRDIERQEREAGRPEGEFRRTLEEVQPGLLDKLADAESRDGDVEISKTDFDKVFSRTKAFKAAFQHVAHEEDGMTARERQDFLAIRERVTKDMTEEQQAELQSLQEVERELAEVREAVRSAIEPALGEEAASGMDAAANATVLQAFILRASTVLGISPKQFVQRYLPEIAQQRLDTETDSVVEVVESAPEMSEAMTEAEEAPVTRVTPVVASAATENPQRQAVEPEPTAEPEVEVAPEVEPEVTEEAAPAPEPAVEPETDEAQLFEGDATPEQIAKFESLLPARNAQGLFDLSNEKRNAKTGRYDNMGAALRAMESGEITRQQRDAIVDIYRPVLPDTRIYPVATPETMRLALNKNQKPLVNAPVEEGRRVGLRLDIKAVTHPKHPARVIAIHERQGKGGGKHIRYTNVARVTNAEMSMVVTRAADVAAGRRNKDKLGVIYGDYVSTTVAEATKIASDALIDPAWRQVGIDPERHGYYYDRKTGEPLVSADEVVQVGSQVFAKNAKVAGKEQFLYSKEDGKKVLGKAGFEGTDAIKKILLDPDAKPTTLMHELMHWNLELMSDMSLNIEQKAEADRTALEKQVLKDTTTLLEWAGYEGTLEGWRRMDLDARKPFHEAIAASFELFLYKGEAPSRQLRGIFQRLLNYINESYKQIVTRFQKEYQDEFKRPLPALNDDVRAIFGRMMSAERDTMDFFDQYDMTSRLVTRKQWEEAGRDPKDYDEYDRDFKDAIAEAQAELTQRRMEEVGWQGRARERTGGKIREERRRTEAKAREDIDAEVRETQVFQLQSFIYNGYYRTEEKPRQTAGEFPSTRLSYEAVAAIDKEMAKKLAKRGLLKKGDGMPLNVARKMFGYESNEQMLQELSESRSIKDEVEYRLDRYMVEEQSGLTDPVLVEERIQAAIHNRMRERVIGLELRYILNNGKNTKAELALARELAREIIEKTPTGDINLTSYNRAAARARKKALKALKDGDMEAAAFAKRQELLNEALIREGGKAREEVRKLINANKRVFRRRSDKALAASGYEVNTVKALRALLSQLGIGGVFEGDPDAAVNAMRDSNPEFSKEMQGEILHFAGLNLPEPRVGDRRKQVERLTVTDAKRLRTLINIWMKRAKDDRSAVLEGKKQDIKTSQESLLTRISRIPAKDRAINEKPSGFWSPIRDFASDLIRFESLFRRIDGGETGPWTSVFRSIKDAANNLRQAFKGFLDFFQEGLKKLDIQMPGGERMITAQISGARKPIVFGSGNTAAKLELMHFAMHFYGNASNRERLVAGLINSDADKTTVEAGIDRFLQSQIDQGVLTIKDFEFMQSLFDKFSKDGLFKKAQEVMYRTRGYEMDAIKPTSFTVTFPNGRSKEFQGGYIPVRYDNTEDGGTTTEAVLEEGQISPEQQHMRAMEYLPSFTKNRVNDVQAGRALVLDLREIVHHANEVYRFIYMTEPGTDAYKIINGIDGKSPVKAAFVARYGNKAYGNLMAWLKRSTYQQTEREALQAGEALNALARNANMGVMFLNAGNALQNYSGLTIPMRRLGFSRVANSLIRTMFNGNIRKDIIAKSKEMAVRLDRQVFDILQNQRKLVTSKDSMWERIKDWTNKHAYILQQITQNHVDVAIWQAAYNKRVQELGGGIESEAEAVAYADSEVRRTQMAGEREDLSMFESQGGVIKAFFPFKSWFINWGNTTYAQARLDVEQTEVSKYAALASTYFYALMVPAMLASAATMVARGELGEQFEDDDDDGYGDEAFIFWARSQLDQIFGGIPILDRGWQTIANNWFDDEYWNNRYPILPWERAYENVITGTTKLADKPIYGGLELSSEIATLFFGVPARAAFKRMSLIGDEIAGELESESTYDLFRGAVTGQRSDLQRLSQ